ncbi:hypothetical protein NQ315_012848, partial [Exocentrus adspersus]
MHDKTSLHNSFQIKFGTLHVRERILLYSWGYNNSVYDLLVVAICRTRYSNNAHTALVIFLNSTFLNHCLPILEPILLHCMKTYII